MSNEDFTLQASYKLPNQDLINVRGATPDEFEANLDAMLAAAPKVAQLGQSLRGLVVLAAPAGPPADAGNVQTYQQSGQGIQKPQQAYGAPVDAPTCRHGAMSLNDSKWNDGAGWKAYFCSAPKGDPEQCPPLFWDKYKKAFLPPKDKR